MHTHMSTHISDAVSLFPRLWQKDHTMQLSIFLLSKMSLPYSVSRPCQEMWDATK